MMLAIYKVVFIACQQCVAVAERTGRIERLSIEIRT